MTQDSEATRVLGLVHGQVCYLQLPAANRDRAAAFYEAVFGWRIETHHPDFRGATASSASGWKTVRRPGTRPDALDPRD